MSCFWLAYLIQVDTVNFNTPENSDRKRSQVIDYKKICQTHWKDRGYDNDKKVQRDNRQEKATNYALVASNHATYNGKQTVL